MRCPMSMCPVMGIKKSPWSGEHNEICYGTSHEEDDRGCGYWKTDCKGAQVWDRLVDPCPSDCMMSAMEYDCKHARTCTWQIEAGGALCPPRDALRNGIDPRILRLGDDYQGASPPALPVALPCRTCAARELADRFQGGIAPDTMFVRLRLRTRALAKLAARGANP